MSVLSDLRLDSYTIGKFMGDYGQTAGILILDGPNYIIPQADSTEDLYICYRYIKKRDMILYLDCRNGYHNTTRTNRVTSF